MIRIAICEDLQHDQTCLHLILDKYLKTNDLIADVDCFESGEAFLISFTPKKYQIIFMDIFLNKNGITGMEAAQRVREVDRDAAIILIATSLDYGIEGYNVAVYYIVKPVTEELTENGQKNNLGVTNVTPRHGGEGEIRTLAPVSRPIPLAGAPLRPT